MDNSSKQSRPLGEAQQPRTPLLEWTFAILGGLIVSGLILYNIFDAWQDNGSAPEIQIQADSPIRQTRGFLIPIKALNQGGSSAAGVVIEGVLRDGDKDVETSQVTFDYVPAHSTKEGGLFFSRNPQSLELEIRALGYQEP